MAQVSQVDITPAGTFEIIPSIGNHIILFGDGSNCRQKFHRLLTFYKEVLAKTGLNTYSVIHAGYDQQIVAVRKDKAARMADSAQAISLMKTLSSSVNRMLMDSLAVIDPAITDPVITTPAAADTGQTNKKIVRTISPSKTVLMKTTPVKTIVKPKSG
jgi:cell division protein FtsQ